MSAEAAGLRVRSKVKALTGPASEARGSEARGSECETRPVHSAAG